VTQLEAELAFTAEIANENAKNYQLWFGSFLLLPFFVCVVDDIALLFFFAFHGSVCELMAFVSRLIFCNFFTRMRRNYRKCVIDMLKSRNVQNLGQSELEFIAVTLDDDNKNYHAWGYRYQLITVLI
jgi:hypothetical protein